MARRHALIQVRPGTPSARNPRLTSCNTRDQVAHRRLLIVPVLHSEAEIVKTLAIAGSVNHQLLVELMDKGAILTGTESAELVTKEYHQLRDRLAVIPHDAPGIQARHAARAGLLLGQRDRYIANRINATLRAGEIGILFIGLLHAVEPHLAGDVLVEHPIQRLPTRCTP